ncbi:MAG TPA: hypothetical protein VGZ22_09910 [Isosphaeraceae bacterium]|jgi:hypothetical protein|nr:hypothetical protein [Isosphaeraceae bacterium]
MDALARSEDLCLGRVEVSAMKALLDMRQYVGTVLFALTVAVGIYAFVSMGKALGHAVGVAYSQPPEDLD